MTSTALNTPVSILDTNSLSGDGTSSLSAQDQDLLRRRRQTLGPQAPVMYSHPLHIVAGKGVWLTDSEGHQYLDMYNNVAGVGHCHPHVVDAITQQAAVLNTNTRYLHDNIVDYAERLLSTFPDSVNRVLFTCTGSEANDLAIRIAKGHTGKQGVIVTDAAYHGGTTVVAACSPSSGGHADWVQTVPAPDTVATDCHTTTSWLAEVQQAADSLESKGYGVAALLVDTIFSSDGIHPGTQGMIKSAVEEVQRRGGLFIADEVQPGFGRLGTAMWGFDRHEVRPDLITTGKPMANGMPVAALLGASSLLDAFGAGENYFNTFGGNPVSMAAASAVLDVIEKENLREHVKTVGTLLRDGISDVLRSEPGIVTVRGSGFFIGVEFRDELGQPNTERANTLIGNLRENGVLISSCGYWANVLKIRPPMVLGESEAELFCDRLTQVL